MKIPWIPERHAFIFLPMSKLVLFRCWSQRLCLGSILKIQATRTKSKDRPSHLLDGYRTAESKQITPRQPIPILELDGLEQTPCLVEVCIIGPTAFGVKPACFCFTNEETPVICEWWFRVGEYQYEHSTVRPQDKSKN